ncbi:SGNH/GDSL hydrolase family protein [Spirosoma foliorum]|uniref:SGNH/GDSL hydrolase family protein n=1 Tax=Spirosoma foliorum TaxID=2710596 RepID=A0A7G5GTX8_9BACT|nr:SGNH/GDSL hydrolase family protein [Spirosoma foliorum]
MIVNKLFPFFKIQFFIQCTILGLLGCLCTTNALAQPCDPHCVLITVRRILPGSGGGAALAAPSFKQSSNVIPFGDTLKITSPSLPAGAVIEYSKDNGSTWTTGDQVVIDNKVNIVARVRLNQQLSPLLQGSFTPSYQRMLVIGNSIMSHGPAPDLGWYNFNGMAASAPEKDFVHLLTARLQTLNPTMTVQLQSGVGIELDFGKPTYAMDEFDQPLQSFKPDLILIRLGENVVDGDVSSRNFEGQFRQLLDRLKQVSTTNGQLVQIVITTTVWDRPLADAAIRKVTAEKAYPLVDLSSMVGKSQYFASQYANPGVAAHPNDAGMQQISDLIWVKFQ